MAQALEAWHKAGAASGDIAFWRQHVEAFTSPKAYALVVEALLDAGDLVAAMALLVQWLSQAGQLPLEQGEFSFHVLARRWLAKACAAAEVDTARASPAQSAEAQTLVRKFFDVLEANADDFWLVPDLERPGPRSARRKRTAGEDEELPEEDRELFAAAYDEMVYVDSTGDGVEADMLESESPGQKTDYELELEGRRVRRTARLSRHRQPIMEDRGAGLRLAGRRETARRRSARRVARPGQGQSRAAARICWPAWT